ncbi:hypothetical protein MRB53_037954 [Persea americana]|nr:hypothetical protein MRB53_037954 [Persea americana]
MSYTQCKIVGNGSFGVVFQTKLSPSGEDAAIKRVLQDKRFKLKAFYYSNGDRVRDTDNLMGVQTALMAAQKDEVYLNLVLEYVPETVYRASRHFNKLKTTMPILEVKLYIYHFSDLLHTFTHQGGMNFANFSDVWSTGCVMAELMLGQPLFPGESGIDQLVEIIKVLGTPTRDEIRTMNPNYMEHKFPQIKPHPFNNVFRKADSVAINLISRLLEYTPTQRLSAIDAMVHPFFDELRDPETRLPDSRHANNPPKELPALFDFSHHELSINPALNHQLVPPHMRPILAEKGLDIDNLKPMQKEQMLARLDEQVKL